MRDELTILLTGAGAPGTRGALYALRHNPDGVRIRTVGTDLRPDGIGRLWLDAFHQVDAPEAPEYVGSLLALCQSEGVDLVIPQTTREIAVLARHKQAFAAAGVPVMVADAAAIDLANDKGRLLELFGRLGLPYPAFHPTRSPEELRAAAAELGYPARPVAVKPPVSNGMRGFRILREEAWDLRRFLAEKPTGVEIGLEELLAILSRGDGWPELLVTEYLPGPEYSVDAFLRAQAALAVPRLRREIRSGISFANEVEYRQDLMETTLAVGRAIGLRYAFGFQYKLDEAGTAKVLECNPRLQGTMVASLFGGVNVIWMGVREALGEPVAEVPAELTPASFLRYWGGIGLQGGKAYEI